MKYKKCIMLICLSICILFTLSGVFANDALNETIAQSDLDSQELQVNVVDANFTDLGASDGSSASAVYFDASASVDGDGSKAKPYKTFKADRISYGTTAYFADGIYDIEPVSIHSSSAYKTTFVGQSLEKTILRSAQSANNKFGFTVTTDSYFVLKNLTMIGIHINNQANLVADNVVFAYGKSFNPLNPPVLSYSYDYKKYNSTFGGVIICDTPSGKVTTLDLSNCQFINNSAVSGGVIAAYNSIVDIQNCVFYNSTVPRFGGAIYADFSKVNIYDSYFELSNAKYGGAIYANSSTLYLKDNLFKSSQSFSFGGVVASFSSDLEVIHSFFEDSAALEDAGGAIYATRGTLKVTDSSFKNGHSDFGGAICSLKVDSTISNTEFVNNYAVYYGGSIYTMYGDIIINKNKFINSNAGSGGSVFNRISDSFSVSDNQFVNSTADNGEIIFIDGSKVDVQQKGNVYDSSYALIKYGNIYDIDYYQSVPLLNVTVEALDGIPSSYDSRKYGYITPAKDQIQGGNCWAFAGISTLEACINKATGIAYDFSEENVKNLMSEYSLFGLENEINAGGNLYMFIAYLAGWFGPIPDELDIYDDYSSLSVIYDSIFHVQNVYVLPERETFFDNDAIKRAVMEYGAVSISIDLSETEGHAVTIVGWDDEFTSNDFLDNKAVGAWIIKNSWGTNWGYDGFEYLSYQQPINFGYTFIFDDDRGYTDIYQYDFAGKSGYHSINSQEVYLKNIFTAKNNEILSAFSTYFDEPTNFTALIYVNGQLATAQAGYSELGYYTIPLDKEIPLKKGDTFEIVIKFSNPAPVYIPLGAESEINMLTFDKGISYYSTDGVHWFDLFESNSGVACIKAFTRLEKLNTVSIDGNQFSGDNPLGKIYVDDLVNIEFDVPQEYVVDGVKHSLDGVVTFTINNQSYYATPNHGKVSLNTSFDKEGTYYITIQYNSNREVSNLIQFKVNVEKGSESSISIDAPDVSKFYGASDKYVATFTDDGKVLKNVNVRIAVNGKEEYYQTNTNGQVILDLNTLPVGVYDIRAQYGGKVVTSKFTVLSTISVNDVTQDFLDSYISASFLNIDGNALSNTDVSFSVGLYGVNSVPLEVNATTNAVGTATAKVNLYVDKYVVTAVNPVNGEKKEFILEIAQIDSSCIVSITQLGSTVTIRANVNPVQASGYVNFILSGNVYKSNIVNGVATLRLNNLAIGDYNVTAVYSSDINLRVSSDTRPFSVTDNPYKLSSGNYWSYYGGSGSMAKITDEQGNGIKGERVKATIDDKVYFNTTDDDGVAWFNLDLDVGNYSIVFEYKGQTILNYVFVYPTILMVDSDAEYLNSKLGAKVISPFENDPLEGLNVKFIVNGKEYTATADSQGYASVKVDLPVGTHTVTTVNLVNGETKQSKVTVYKTTPTISVVNSKRGDTLILTATLTQSTAIGNVVFTMGSKKYTTAIKDGKAMLALNVLDEGSYEAYANYIGDANFNNILSPVIKFEYAHTRYAITAAELTKYYGGPENFKINLTNYNNPVSGAIVHLVIGGKSYDLKTDSKGIATFDANLNPGSHVLECSFEDAVAQSAINVESTIVVNEGRGDVSYSTASATILDANGNPAKNKVVTFKIGNNEYKQTTDASGVATLSPNLDKGTYTVTITNPVTGEVEYSTLIITKTTPTLTLSQVKVDGQDALKAVLPKTATGVITFKLNDVDEYSPDLVGGVSILEDVDPGEYNAVVTYNGDDNFNPTSASIKFKVTKVIVTDLISLSSAVTTTYGTSKNIIVTLVDSDDEPLVGKTITVTLNNKNYNAVTIANGQAKVAIPTSLAVKKYVATVSYKGGTNIVGKTITVSVTVNKATPKLTASAKTLKLKDKTKKYVVTLKTDKNKVYKNQKITVKVNGKTYSAKTNSKGQATFKLTKLTKKGTFKATVKFAGNSNYKSVSKTVKITVKK